MGLWWVTEPSSSWGGLVGVPMFLSMGTVLEGAVRPRGVSNLRVSVWGCGGLSSRVPLGGDWGVSPCPCPWGWGDRVDPCVGSVRGIAVAWASGPSLKQLSGFPLHRKGEMGPLGRKGD